jgi:hydrogenase-1 operon protein HyaE
MSGVIDALAAHPGVDVLRKSDLDDFLSRNPRSLLFFLGDRSEGLDVAVVVRKLATSYQDRLRVGLVDQRDEAALMTRFGVVVMPAVVYMRDGQPAELVARMRDWPVFAQAADRLLDEAAAAPLTGGNA